MRAHHLFDVSSNTPTDNCDFTAFQFQRMQDALSANSLADVVERTVFFFTAGTLSEEWAIALCKYVVHIHGDSWTMVHIGLENYLRRALSEGVHSVESIGGLLNEYAFLLDSGVRDCILRQIFELLCAHVENSSTRDLMGNGAEPQAHLKHFLLQYPSGFKDRSLMESVLYFVFELGSWDPKHAAEVFAYLDIDGAAEASDTQPWDEHQRQKNFEVVREVVVEFARKLMSGGKLRTPELRAWFFSMVSACFLLGLIR